MNLKDLKIGDTVKWNDPDNGVCSGEVVVRKIFALDEVEVCRVDEEDTFIVMIHELSIIPKPNEIWRTQSGNIVLVVEHPMIEIDGNLGFIWFDSNDKTMNFTPLEDQLVEKLPYHTISSWGTLMNFAVGEG